MGKLFIFLGLLIFGAHFFAVIFSKWKVPDVIFLIAIGIIAGPVLHWVSPEMLENIGPAFSSLTLLFILFDSGVDMSINDVRHHWGSMTRIMLASMLLAAVAVTATGVYIGMAWGSALLLGTILSGTAAAIVIPLIKHLPVSKKTSTVLSLESALSAVISIVVSWAIVEGLSIGRISPMGTILTVVFSLLLAIGLGLAGGIVWGVALDQFRRRKHSMFLTPSLMFIIYGLVELLGYNGSIAALAFGITMGNPTFFTFKALRRFRSRHNMSEYMRPLDQNEKTFYKEIVFVLKTLFFVYIGICIPFDSLTTLLYGLLFTIVIFAARILLAIMLRKKFSRRDRISVAMMAPKGLAAAVLASIPEQVNLTMGYNVIPGADFIKEVTFSVIFCSIIITSLVVLLFGRKMAKYAEETTSNTTTND